MSNPLIRAWDRIEALPTWVFMMWITTLLVVRTGVSWSGTEELERFAQTFPHPGATFRSNAVLGPSLAWATGLDTHTKWLLLHAGLTVGWFALTALLLHRRLGHGRTWRVAMVWLTFLATPASLLRHLGGYDIFTAIGVTLVALGGSPLLVLLGGAVMGATNVEQGVLAVACGSLVHWAIPGDEGVRTKPRETASRFAAALVGLALSRIVVIGWFHQLGAVVQGRFVELRTLLPDSLFNAASLGTTGAYAWLSIGWVVVVAILWQLRNRPERWIAAGIGLVALPALATITTMDGSRVFGAVGGVALLVALVYFAEMSNRSDGNWIRSFSAALMVFGILIPAMVTTYRGELRIPWRFILAPLL